MIAIPNDPRSWHYRELERILREQDADAPADTQSVHLTNPAHRDQIDRMIRGQVWPGIVKAFVGTDFLANPCSKSGDVPDIEDKWDINTKRSFLFLVESRLYPAMPGDDPCFCRITVICGLCEYMINTDFYLYLPTDFSLRRIAGLLTHPAFAACPPSLSAGHGCEGLRCYTVAFQSGHGRGGAPGYGGLVTGELEETIHMVSDVMRCVYELADDCTDGRAFGKVKRRLVKMFGERE